MTNASAAGRTTALAAPSPARAARGPRRHVGRGGRLGDPIGSGIRSHRTRSRRRSARSVRPTVLDFGRVRADRGSCACEGSSAAGAAAFAIRRVELPRPGVWLTPVLRSSTAVMAAPARPPQPIIMKAARREASPPTPLRAGRRPRPVATRVWTAPERLGHPAAAQAVRPGRQPADQDERPGLASLGTCSA
jgi:hypothetical protein